MDNNIQCAPCSIEQVLALIIGVSCGATRLKQQSQGPQQAKFKNLDSIFVKIKE
jgi:hypothetical protein